jgi:hypothetical protein
MQASRSVVAGPPMDVRAPRGVRPRAEGLQLGRDGDGETGEGKEKKGLGGRARVFVGFLVSAWLTCRFRRAGCGRGSGDGWMYEGSWGAVETGAVGR